MASPHENREHFIQAYEQIKKGGDSSYHQLSEGLRNYILYPYLEHAYLKKNIETVKDAELIIFIKRFPNTVLTNDIRDEWIERLAIRKNWERVISYYVERNSQLKTRCFYNEALIRTGQAERGFKQGKSLWMTKNSLPDECDGLSKVLRRYNQLSAEDYWQRIKLLMSNNKVSLATKLSQRLPSIDQKLFNNWKAVHNKPEKYLPRYLKREFTAVDTPHARDIITHGAKRLAKRKQETAETLWQQLKKQYHFSDAETGDVESYIYARAARDHKVGSLPYLSQIPQQARSKDANIWMARIALRTGNWQALLDAIDSMDAKTKKDDSWIYWKAKALEQLGNTAQATQLFTENTKNATFYGFLSADHLKQPYHVLDQAKPDRSAQIERIKKLIGIQRALELYAVGLPDLAAKEWLNTISSFNKEEKLAAAELALQHGQAFIAIVTVSKTKDWNIVDLRFPLLFKQLVTQYAAQQGVDPAWVYGVIRRESAFKTDALSRVKALGLMQLMPKTARNVSRALGLKGLVQTDFTKPAINIQLGSRYLSDMLNRFNGNYPKATAAYNAGPGRIPGWMPDTQLAADQWTESIPFDETRKYVRGVLTYTTIYDHKLHNNKGRKLSSWLVPITPSD